MVDDDLKPKRMSAWRDVWQRSVQHLRDESSKILRAAPLGPHPTDRLELAAIRNRDDLRHFVYGCDADMNGLSKAALDVDVQGKGRFFGHLNGTVHPDLKLAGRRVDRSGYAGMRTRNRQTLFGTMCWDTSSYNFLKVRIRGPPPKSLASQLRYFVNIQTDGPVQSDLYQHRLWLGDSGAWEDILIPFADFALTNSGEMATTQMAMMREKVRTIGISVMLPTNLLGLDTKTNADSPSTLLTADKHRDHPFDLGIESFECTNVADHLPSRPVLANASTEGSDLV